MWILLYGYKIDNQMDSFGNQRAVVNVARARGHECRKPIWVKDSSFKEKMLLCKQAEKRRFLMKTRELDFEPLEQWNGDSNVIPNSPDMYDNDIQTDQNDVECDDEALNKLHQLQSVRPKASPIKHGLWHRRLSHLNFDYINLLSKKDVVIGLPKLKYVKDQLCSSCEDNVDSIFYVQGMKKPEVLKDFLIMIQQNLQALVISVRTDRGTEFLNKTLHAFFKEEGIEHQKLILLEPPEQTALSKIFDEIKEMSETSVANDTSGLVPQRQKASDYDNSNPDPQLQNVSPSADTTVPSQQELDLLFGPLYDEFFNAGTSRVNKSSSPTDNSAQQDILPSTNIHPTTEPSTPTHVNAEENNNDQAEFTNPFCTPVQEVAESSSRNIGNSNMHTFNQPQDSEYRWTKDHPKSSSVLQIQVWETRCKPFGKKSSKLKVVMEKQKDDDQHCNSQTKQRPCSKGLCSGRGVLISRSFTPVLAWKRLFVYVHKPDGLLIPDHPEKFYRLGSLYYGFETSSKSHDPQSPPLFQMSTMPDAIDTRKSTSGGIQFLGDKLVSWMSKKQDCTAMSSAEAEYVALSASCAQVMWMRTQLKDYGFNYNKIPLYCDSQSAIAISCNPVQHSRTKHIHTRYHFIKEQVENGIIELYFVRTEYQLADMFTKALPEDRFQYLVIRIGMRCLTPAKLEVLTNESA
ncbi:retrovirus-related pol polyprotein from transposon TNT 1-94 [Tanacetum coccineum]